MPATDSLASQLSEAQSAVQHALQETGVAGTGPVQLPPPATVTTQQVRSEVPGDAGTYSNTLHVQLYRDADGKLWTQPGAGHMERNVDMRIDRLNGQWRVVTEVSKVVAVLRRGTRTIVREEPAGIGGSGARGDWQIPSDRGHGWGETDAQGQPVRSTEARDAQRYEQFTPGDLKTAIRQSLWSLQAHHAIYDPTPTETTAPAGVTLETFTRLTTMGIAAAVGLALVALLTVASVAGLGRATVSAEATLAPATAPATTTPAAAASPTAAVAATTPAPTPTAAPAAFQLGMEVAYQHFQGSSVVCAMLSTTPAQPGASLNGSLSGPAMSGPQPPAAMLDARGMQRQTVQIAQYGTYTFTYTAASAAGTRAQATKSIDVTQTPGAGCGS